MSERSAHEIVASAAEDLHLTAEVTTSVDKPGGFAGPAEMHLVLQELMRCMWEAPRVAAHARTWIGDQHDDEKLRMDGVDRELLTANVARLRSLLDVAEIHQRAAASALEQATQISHWLGFL